MTLDDLRDQLGLTWAELARALDVPWSTLTGWRSRGLPGAVVAIARLYAAHPAEVGAWLEAVDVGRLDVRGGANGGVDSVVTTV